MVMDCDLITIKWGRGSQEYPSDFSLYSLDLKEDLSKFFGDVKNE